MKKTLIIGGIVILLALAAFFVYQNNRVQLKNATYTMNINSDLSEIDLSKLLKGDTKLIDKATINTKDVNVKKAGEYKAKISCGGKSFSVTIYVKDQVKPEMTLYSDSTSAGVNQELKAADMIKEVKEDSDYTSGFCKDAASKDPSKDLTASLTYDSAGTYNVLVVVVDSEGNYASSPLSIKIVDDKTPPVLSGVADLVVQKGDSIDKLFSSIKATDDTDGDITSKITIDTSKVDVNTVGSYTVSLSVTDGSKNTTTATLKLSVVDKNAVQNSGHTVDIPAGTDFSQFSTEAVPYGFGTDVDANNRPTGCSYYATKYGKYAADFIQPLSNNVYLTFDEGYEYGNTPAILDTLKAKGVKATFFVTLPFAKDNPDLIKRMLAEGHVIGNHTVTHPSAGLQSLSVADQINEIKTVHQYMLDNYNYEMYLFRFPTGKFSEQSLAIVQSLGYRSVFWSFAHKDWDVNNQPDVGESLKKVTASLHGGEIFLLHGVSNTDTAMLGDLIDAIKAKGLNCAYYERMDK